MAEPTPADPDAQLEEVCRVLNHYEVSHLVVGSHVDRLNGVPLETIDVDLVPPHASGRTSTAWPKP